MSKKILLAALALSLCGTIALANEASSTNKVIRQEKIAERQAALGAKHAERLAAMRSRIKVRWADHWVKLHERLAKAIEQLGNLASQVDSRIAKFEAQGENPSVAPAKAKLAEAKTAIETAKTKLAALESQVETIVDTTTASTTPRQTATAIRQAVQEVIKSIKTAHQKIVEAIVILKGADQKN